MCSRTLKVLFVRKGYAWQQPGGGIRGKECRLLPHPKPTEMLEQNCVSDTAECGRRRRGLTERLRSCCGKCSVLLMRYVSTTLPTAIRNGLKSLMSEPTSSPSSGSSPRR